MDSKEAVKALNDIDTSDFERAHLWADDILLRSVPQEIRDAYLELAERARFQYA